MLMSLGDFLKKRKEIGHSWPSRGLIYQWKYCNYFDFSNQCIRMLSRKLLIDTNNFDKWMEKNMKHPNEIQISTTFASPNKKN